MRKTSPAIESFYSLTPEVVLAGVEAAGFATTGEYIQLNSYENRVFDVRLEPGNYPDVWRQRLIAKYYRPGRWSLEALEAEHGFLRELQEAGIPVIAPIAQSNQRTLSQYQGLWLALFPKAMGRMPQELNTQELAQLGRTLARLHNVGEQQEAPSRPTLHPRDYGWPALDVLTPRLLSEVRTRYIDAAERILEHLEDHLDESRFLRIHGDCHKGNLLQLDSKAGERDFFLVDFDDFCNGPAVQDFWMLFSGDKEYAEEEREALLSGYEELREFQRADLKLMEPLRGLRILHYAAWIARRWEDPSFPHLFPHFGSYNYWAEETEALEKIAWSLDEAPH